MILACAIMNGNRKYYLYNGDWYWTMTPQDFGGAAIEHVVQGTGAYNDRSVEQGGNVRPVLNLSLEVLNNGDGSMNDPYHV